MSADLFSEMVDEALPTAQRHWTAADAEDVAEVLDAAGVKGLLAKLEADERASDERAAEIVRLRKGIVEVAKSGHELGPDGRLAKARAILGGATS